MTGHLKSQFLLNPEITYLNFGSFGACPKPIFEAYQGFQLELEREPVQFMINRGQVLLKQSREALAEYVNCDADDLVYVTNPSYAVNIVAKNLKLGPGDEILTTNLEYGACDKTLNYYCSKSKARYVRQNIDLPIRSKSEVVDCFFRGLSPRTKAVFISHITSTTGLILPVKEICRKAKEKGLMTIVDGAHVPGHIPLDLRDLDADIYTGACHKWMMAPKGCTFLFVKKTLQHQLDPLVISWGYDSAFPSSSIFQDYHQAQGTRDFTAFLTIPESIRFMKEHKWDEVAKACRELVRLNATKFCELLETGPITPVTEDFLGQMFSIPIKPLSPERLQRYLFQTYNIEIPVMPHEDKVFLRYSINAFNSQADLDRLYMALKEIIEVTDFISVPSQKI